MTAVAPPKAINLKQLEQELAAAGVVVRGLTASGTTLQLGQPALVSDIYTYDGSGNQIDLPDAALPVIAAHVPQPNEYDQATGDVRTNYAATMTRLDQIIGATTPTNAQVVAAIQDLARNQKRLMRLLRDMVGG